MGGVITLKCNRGLQTQIRRECPSPKEILIIFSTMVQDSSHRRCQHQLTSIVTQDIDQSDNGAKSSHMLQFGVKLEVCFQERKTAELGS